MILAVVAVLFGLALGVGAMLILARPGSLHSTHMRAARRKPAPLKGEPAPPKPAATPVLRGARREPTPLKSEPAPTRPAAAPVLVERSHDEPTGAPRPVDFPEAVLKAAWQRQGGLCAECGRLLIWANRDRDSGIGAWQSHHRTPRDQNGSSNLTNCVLFCSSVANCHFHIGHGGIGWNHYSPLEDAGLLYLRHGAEKASTNAPQTRARPGLSEKVFGILVPARPKRHSKPKPHAKRSRPSLPLVDDYDEAY